MTRSAITEACAWHPEPIPPARAARSAHRAGDHPSVTDDASTDRQPAAISRTQRVCAEHGLPPLRQPDRGAVEQLTAQPRGANSAMCGEAMTAGLAVRPSGTENAPRPTSACSGGFCRAPPIENALRAGGMARSRKRRDHRFARGTASPDACNAPTDVTAARAERPPARIRRGPAGCRSCRSGARGRQPERSPDPLEGRQAGGGAG